MIRQFTMNWHWQIKLEVIKNYFRVYWIEKKHKKNILFCLSTEKGFAVLKAAKNDLDINIFVSTFKEVKVSKSYDYKIKDYSSKNNIPVQYHYPYSLNKTGALSKKIKKTKLINSENWSRECISLPLHPLMRVYEAKRVVNLIKKYFRY